MPEAKREPADAETIARKHPAVEALCKRRSRVLLVEPRPPHRGEAADNQVVVYFDYQENRSVVALVDVVAKDVVAVAEIPAFFQLSDEEQREAETLAASDERVASKLRGRSMNPLTRLYFPRKVTADVRAHRYAIVFLRPTERERHYAIVDLSAHEVVEVLSRQALTGR